jgi:hypothetical protein
MNKSASFSKERNSVEKKTIGEDIELYVLFKFNHISKIFILWFHNPKGKNIVWFFSIFLFIVLSVKRLCLFYHFGAEKGRKPWAYDMLLHMKLNVSFLCFLLYHIFRENKVVYFLFGLGDVDKLDSKFSILIINTIIHCFLNCITVEVHPTLYLKIQRETWTSHLIGSQLLYEMWTEFLSPSRHTICDCW